MSDRKTWTTEDEINFIDTLPTKRGRLSVRQYAWVLRDRDHWADVDRTKVMEHLKERMQ